MAVMCLWCLTMGILKEEGVALHVNVSESTTGDLSLKPNQADDCLEDLPAVERRGICMCFYNR